MHQTSHASDKYKDGSLLVGQGGRCKWMKLKTTHQHIVHTSLVILPCPSKSYNVKDHSCLEFSEPSNCTPHSNSWNMERTWLSSSLLVMWAHDCSYKHFLHTDWWHWATVQQKTLGTLQNREALKIEAFHTQVLLSAEGRCSRRQHWSRRQLRFCCEWRWRAAQSLDTAIKELNHK